MTVQLKLNEPFMTWQAESEARLLRQPLNNVLIFLPCFFNDLSR